jgi:glycosyltransferase involved in cell wall biosynthesis
MLDSQNTSPMPTILVFSTVDWHALWHRPQAVMSRLATEGWRVLYVDTVGLRTPRIRDLPRIISRLKQAMKIGVGVTANPAPGVRLISPLLVPFLNSRLARRLNVRLLLSQLRRYVDQDCKTAPIIWVYLPTWAVLQCIHALPSSLLVYEAIDALGSNPAGVSRDFHASEKEILTQADLVIASSQTLYQQKVPDNPNAHWVPSGVSESFFLPQDLRAEIRAVQSPRIGFFGTLDHRLDLELMFQLAEQHPDWSFVLIGPARCDIGPLIKLANVHWLGARPHSELPGFLAGLDVIFLPYVLDQFTHYIYPAKIQECLAFGLPVVATALPSLAPFKSVVRLVQPGQDFSGPLKAALAEDDAELRKQRIDIAQANSWETRIGEIRTLVEAAIATRGARS